MGVPGISLQMGVRGLISVNLGVLDMKKFGNHCSRYKAYWHSSMFKMSPIPLNTRMSERSIGPFFWDFEVNYLCPWSFQKVPLSRPPLSIIIPSSQIFLTSETFSKYEFKHMLLLSNFSSGLRVLKGKTSHFQHFTMSLIYAFDMLCGTYKKVPPLLCCLELEVC